MRPRRAGWATVTGVVVTSVLGLASLAWACTVQARVGAINPEAGPPGTRVTISVEDFNPGPVDIRWNGTDGLVLGTANGPSMSMTVTIPDDAPGFYSVVAVQGSGSDVVGKASASFEVTMASFAERGGYRSGDGSKITEPGGSASESSTAGAASAPRTTGSSPAASRSFGNGGVGFAAEAYEPDGAGNAEPGPQAARSAAGEGEGGGASNALGAGSPRREAGLLAATRMPDRLSAPPRTPTRGATAASERAVVSERTSAADLWSGFGSGSLQVGPSLESDSTTGHGANPAAIGAGLGIFGLVGLLGGFGTAELRRRRVLVGTVG